MAKLTPEQFEQIFTVAPNGQRRYGAKKSFADDPVVQSNIRKMVVADETDPNAPRRSAAEVRQDIEDASTRMQQNVAAGILSVPAAVPAAVGIISEGIPALIAGISNADDNESYVGSTVDEFADRMIDEKETKELDALAIAATMKFIQQTPDAGVDDIKAFQQQYFTSDEFYNEVQQRIPTSLRWANNVQQLANNLVGLDVRPDQMTAGDDVTQAVSGAFVGLPAKTVQTVTNAVAKRVGTRVANNLITRIGARTLEAITPLTLPLNKTNIAVNAGAGVAMTEGMRYMAGDDTLIDYDQVFEAAAEDPSLPVAAGAAAAVMAPGALNRSIQRNVAKGTSDALGKLVKKEIGGRSLNRQAIDTGASMGKGQNAATGLIDDVQQLKKAGQEFNATPDELDDLEIAGQSGTFNARRERENRLTHYGELDLTHKTIPLMEIQRAFDASGPQREKLEAYLKAIARKQDTDLQMAQLMKDTQDTLSRISVYKSTGKTNLLAQEQTKLKQLQQDYAQISADTPASRPSLSQWSRSEVDNAIRQGNNNPAFKRVRDAITKYTNDLGEFAVRHGEMSLEDFKNFRASRGLYIPLQERSGADFGRTRRVMHVWGNRIKRSLAGSSGEGQDTTLLRSGRDLSVREGGKVDLTTDVMSALKMMTSDVVQRVHTNEARRNIVDQLLKLPNARGNLLREYEFTVGGRKTNAMSRKQFDVFLRESRMNLDKYVRVNDGNSVRLVEFRDPGLKQLVEFNPNATMPILNSMRKVFQMGMTGLLRPAFAGVQFLREPWSAMLGKRDNRSFGFLGMYAKRLAEGSVLDKFANTVDPTGIGQAGLQVPNQIFQRAVKATADKIVSDLANDNGIFAQLLQQPATRAYVENIAQKMSLALEQTAYGIMTKRMSTSFGHLNAMTDVIDDWNKGSNKYVRMLGAAAQPYKAVLESIHMATRVAFWDQNLGTLSKKYGGVSKIPERELRLLERDTRELGGDMSRRSKSKAVQVGLSTVPYGNTIAQGGRHFLSLMVTPAMASASNKMFKTNIPTNRSSNFYPTFFATVAMPKLMSMAVMSEWGEAEDWWYNKTPSWQRLMTLPVPTVEAMAHRMQTGKWPDGDPGQHFWKIPLAPEIALISAPLEAGINAMGIMGKGNVEKPSVVEGFKAGLGTIFDIPTPPAIGLFMAHMGQRADIGGMVMGQKPQEFYDTPLGGANADKVSPRNSMTQTVYNMIGSVLGSAGKNVADALNVAELSYKDGDSIMKSAQKAFSTYISQERQGLPEVGIPAVWNPSERKYAYTPEAQYVSETLNDLDAVFKQLERERDTKGRAAAITDAGGQLGQTLKDPRLGQLAQVIYDTTNKKGEFKQANESYSTYRAALSGLQRQRMTPAQYESKRRELIHQQQLVRGTQARILREMEQDIQEAVPQFQQLYGQPFSYKALADLIRKDTAR